MSLVAPIRSLPRTLSPGGLRITRLETPGEGAPGEWQALVFEAHVEEQTSQPGLAVAYVDGPAGSIKVKWTGGVEDVPEGYFLALYKRGRVDPACTTLEWPSGGILYPEEGVYTLRLLAGYVSEGTFYYTDYRDHRFTCQAPPPEEVPPEEKPAPPWWEQQFLGIPVWAWIALAGGLSVVGIVAGVVAYEERERELMYTILLARKGR